MRDDVKYVHECIAEAGGLKQVKDSVDLVMEHLEKEHLTGKGEPFISKNHRLAKWKPSREQVYDLVVAMFTTALTSNYLTYQAMVGKHNGVMPHEETIDRVKTTAEVVACMCLADLIDINPTQGEYHTITPNFVIDGIPFVDHHNTVYNRPQRVTSNWDPEQGSMLLGGKLNHHEDRLALDHINKMNSIPMRLNRAFLLKYPEDREIKKYSNKRNLKTPAEITEEKRLWGRYIQDARHKYAHALVTGDRLYLNYKFCTRGRTYAVGHYINTQGSSYKKASLELADKEYLDDILSMCIKVRKAGIFQYCPVCGKQLMRNPEGTVFCPKCASNVS